MDLVSIVMPCFNSEKYIEESLHSIFSQSYLNWEAIIVDDYSNDNSRLLISKYEKIDSRIKPIFLERNVGAAAARNYGLAAAKGKFIAFLDSDDVWLPEKLKKQVAFMKKEEVGISFTSYYVFSTGEFKEYIVYAVDEINYLGYLKNTIIGCSTAMINRDTVGQPLKFQENMRTRQDTKLWLTLLKRGNVAKGINEPLVKYRVHNNSISRNKVKAVYRVWLLYYCNEKLGLFRSIYYFSFYLINAILKRRNHD